MISLSHFPSRTLAALALAAVVGSATSVHALTVSSESSQPVMIYKQLGFAFGFTNSTPSSLLGGFGGGGGGGGGFAGGGAVPPVIVAPAGGNFLIPPAGGSGVALVVPPVIQGGAPIVGGETQTPVIGQSVVAPVPDAGVGPLGFALVLAGMAMYARRFARTARLN